MLNLHLAVDLGTDLLSITASYLGSLICLSGLLRVAYRIRHCWDAVREKTRI